MGNYGIKVSVEGKDITSTTNSDYAMWSKFPIIKTFMVGTVSYSFGSDLSSVDIDITHNLGYRPIAWLSIDGSAQDAQWVTVGYWATWYSVSGNNALRSWTLHTYTDKISIHYRETNVAGSGVNPTGESWNFKYYVFIESIP